MTEFELKFRVPAAAHAGVEAALRRGAGARRQSLQAIYFDTPDGTLAAAGVAVRLRKEGRGWVQALKGKGEGFARLEHEVARGRSRPAQVELGLHRLDGVDKHVRQAMREASGRLVPVLETRIKRLTRRIDLRDASVEIALDQGEILAGKRSVPVREVEFELKGGRPVALVELARVWCDTHGLWLDPATKAMVGRQLARGEEGTAPVAAAALARRKRESATELWADAVQSALDHMLWNAREVALDGWGDEHVHQLRVALRRLRTVLRELRDEGEGIDAEAQASLRDLFRLLGRHRDTALLVPAIQRQLADAGAPAALAVPPLPDVAAAVRDRRAQGAFLAAVALATRLRESAGGDSLKQLRRRGSARLADLYGDVRRDGKKFAQLDEPGRHRVRKRAKALRYLAEMLRPLHGARQVDRFIGDLKQLQDALGEYQDVAAAGRLWREGAAADPAAWFGAGWLAARGAELARECEQACKRAARKAKPFW